METKQEIILFGPPTSVASRTNVLGLLSNNSNTVEDTSLNFDEQASSVVKDSFHQLRTIDTLKPWLKKKERKNLLIFKIQAPIPHYALPLYR